MSDRDALFQAILDAPDDDAPRLVFADWLDENGEADRAEFIRVQCRLARLPFYEAEYDALVRCASTLIGRYRKRWQIARIRAGQRFRRGFVDEVSLSSEAFLGWAADLFRAAPIRRVHFTRVHAYGDWRLVVPLEGMQLDGGRPWTTRARGEVELPRLRWLKMSGLPICGWFLAEAACPNLDAIDLSGAWANDINIAPYVVDTSPILRIGSLTLSASSGQRYAGRVRPGGAHVLAGANFARLRELRLRRQKIGDAGLSYLARSQSLTTIAELYLHDNDLGLTGTTGIEDLCAAPFTRLRVLELSGNPLSPISVRELARWPGLARLRWLDLSACGLSEAAIYPLARSQHLHAQLGLRLSDNAFDPTRLFPADLLRRPASVS